MFIVYTSTVSCRPPCANYFMQNHLPICQRSNTSTALLKANLVTKQKQTFRRHIYAFWDKKEMHFTNTFRVRVYI